MCPKHTKKLINFTYVDLILKSLWPKIISTIIPLVMTYLCESLKSTGIPADVN